MDKWISIGRILREEGRRDEGRSRWIVIVTGEGERTGEVEKGSERGEMK